MKDRQLIYPVYSSEEGMTISAQEPALFQFEASILPWREQSEKFMAAYIQHVLEQTDGNISEACRVLKMHRACFYKWMKRFGIKRVKLFSRDRCGHFL